VTPAIEVLPDAEALAAHVAAQFVARVRAVQDEGRTPHVVLTGGSISVAIYTSIACLARDARVDWTNVVFWWGDERFVPPDSPDRNAGQARAALLDVVGVPEGNIHEMASPVDAGDVDVGAASYARRLRSGAARHGS
jgi:6-phosphogluconolactonase